MPGASYFKNHGGMSLSDDQMKDIPKPRAELITHVAIKNVQAFGLLGTLIVGPVAAVARRGTRNLSGVLRLATKCGSYGAALGVVTGPLMAMARMKSLNDEEVYDRCYRLRCNRNQVRVDQASMVGAAAGAAAGMFSGGAVALPALVGMNAGILGAAAFNHQHGDKHT